MAKRKATVPKPQEHEDPVEIARKVHLAVSLQAREDYPLFVEHVIRDDKGNTIDLQEIHVEGIKFVQWCGNNGKFPVILAPWGSGKTTAYVLPIALYQIGRDPNIRIGIFSNEENLASDRVGAIKDYIEDSDAFQETFPDVKPTADVWGNHNFLVERDSKDPTPTCGAKGILGSKVGKRYGLIICDDITDESSVHSKAKRDSVTSRLMNTVMGRLSMDGQIIVIGTPWHQQDAVELLKKDTRFAILIQSVSDDCERIEQHNLATGERKTLPLPCNLSPKALRAERDNQPRAFARGRQMQPYTDEEKTFGEDMVEDCVDVGELAVLELKGLPRGIGVDLSSKKRPGNAVAEGAWDDATQRLYIDEMALLAVTSPQLASYVVERWKNSGAEWVVVENNAYQESFKEWTEATHEEAIPIENHTTGRNKVDLINGLPGLSATMKARGIVFVLSERDALCAKGMCECKSGVCKLIKDLKAHPFGDDDSIMALWFLWRQFRAGGSAAGLMDDKSSKRSIRSPVYSARQNLSRIRQSRRTLM